MKNYKARGYVLGRLWGGGSGFYPSEKIEAKTKAELLTKAKRMLEDGTLDGGMGYESLTGAVLEIEEIETITKNGKEYSRSEFETKALGEMTNEEIDYCINHCIGSYD